MLVLGAPPAIRAARQATKAIPIVMVTNQDPVAAGYVESLARPGGNTTGITNLTRELGGKRLELLKEIVPKISRVAILWNSDALEIGWAGVSKNMKLPRGRRRFLLSHCPYELKARFRRCVSRRCQGAREALITLTHIVLNPYQKEIAGLAIKHRIPSMGEIEDYADAGGLMSYAADDDESYVRAAWYVDKILKGAKPADLPVEQPTKFQFVINLQTAKQIGLTIPPNVLARADRYPMTQLKWNIQNLKLLEFHREFWPERIERFDESSKWSVVSSEEELFCFALGASTSCALLFCRGPAACENSADRLCVGRESQRSP